MQDWTGASPVPVPGDGLVLHVATTLTDRGQLRYTYSIAPGRLVTFSTRPGAGSLGPDDPAILAELHQILEAYRGDTRPPA